MLLIISRHNDLSTQDVINWLLYYGAKVCVLNEVNYIEDIVIEIKDTYLKFLLKTSKKEYIDLTEVKGVWFRRGEILFSRRYKVEVINNKKTSQYKDHIINFCKEEVEGIKEFIYQYLYDTCQCLGRPHTNRLNKLFLLHVAKKIGVSIPDTYVTSNIDLDKKVLHHYNFIKPIQEGIFYFIDKTKEDLKMLNKRVQAKLIPYSYSFPTLFQNEIKKQFEIRSFYLNKHFYSIAIFSQRHKKSIYDFRDYSFDDENYMRPFKLPNILEKKLSEIMNYIKLNTGSIDLIYSNTGEYYFLEVNPVGQFGFVSTYGGYDLEKKIAKILLSYEKRKN